MKTFAGFENANCCMDLTLVDEITKVNKEVKFLLVRQDLFEKIKDAKGMRIKETKEYKDTVRENPNIITKKSTQKN